VGDLAAYGYAVLAGIITLFHIALVSGARWGELTQGGRVKGKLDTKGRIMAAISAVLMIIMAMTILGVRGIGPGASFPAFMLWITMAITVLTTIANWITPSAPERRLWGPVTAFMLIFATLSVLT